MSGKQERDGNKGAKAGSTHGKASARDKDKLIAELRNRVEFLEKKLQSGQEELCRSRDELEAKVKQRTKDLQTSERYLDKIFEGIQEGISILDKDMNIVKVNRAMENWYSHMLPLEGKKCYHAFHGRSGACENCPSLRAMRERTMQIGIVPYVGPSGAAGWMELYSFPLMDDRGNVIGVIEHVRDITERKRAEEALESSEAKFRALFENAGAAIFIADIATGEIIDCNQMAENLIGRSRGEIIGLHQTQLHPADKAEEYRKMFMSHLSGTCINNYEAEVQHKDGRVIPVMINGTPLKIIGREIMLGVFLDITGRKRAEEDLKEAKAGAELYLDLMGHDIRNMNMIGMGFLELALGSPDISKKDKELLLMSLGSLENSTRLIENVRKLQKARSGELKHHTVDACQTFLRVLAHYSNMPGVNASFNLGLPATCPVMANELLYEVFENIVGNAIKHGGPGPVIDIKFDQVAAGGRTCNRFIVEDNGPGIPDAMKDKIFNRLQRGNSKAKGMGLGLYLVKSLVENYGGHVWVEDRVQGDHTKGARFVVMLPAVDQ